MTNEQSQVINLKIVEEAKSLMNDRFPMMVKYFIEDTEMYMEEIERAIKDNNVEVAISPAHTIKSSAKQLGVERVSTVAKSLEELSRALHTKGEGISAEFKKLFEQLKKEFEAAMPELNKMC